MKYKIGDIIKFHVDCNIYLKIIGVSYSHYTLKFLDNRRPNIQLGIDYVDERPKVTLDEIMVEEL